MPRTVAAPHLTTSSVPWGKQLETYLRDAGSNNAETRKAAELRLAIFPHNEILTHLPTIWNQEQKRRNRLKILLGITLALAFVLILPVGGFLLFLKYQEGFQNHQTELDLLRLFLMFIGQVGVMISGGLLSFSRNSQPGTIYTLIQHQCVELVPLLIEALPLSRSTSLGEDVRRPLILEALTRLLPRFAVADRPPLTRRQRHILTGELRQFNRTVRNPLATLTPEEADFLSAVLAFLPIEYRRNRKDKAFQSVSEIVENLALEKMDYHQEPAARTQVREAARTTLVRLSS